MVFLNDDHYGKSTISDNRTCIEKLIEYCKEKDSDYSPEIAESWYLSVFKNFGKQQRASFRITLIRIRDCAKTGHVRIEHAFTVTGVLSSTLKDELKEYISYLHGRLTESATMSYRTSCRDFLLFIHEKGVASIRDLERIVRKYAETVRKEHPEIPGSIYPHMFRRSRASGMYRNGVPLEMISAILAHSSSATTKIYAIPSVEQLREAISKGQIGNEPEKLWEGRTGEIKRIFGLG